MTSIWGFSAANTGTTTERDRQEHGKSDRALSQVYSLLLHYNRLKNRGSAPINY